MFAQLDDHHHGAPHVGVWLSMPLGVQEALVSSVKPILSREHSPPEAKRAGEGTR